MYMLLRENELRAVIATTILLENRMTVLSAADHALLERHNRLVERRRNNPYLMRGLEEGLRELQRRDAMMQEGVLSGFMGAFDKLSGGFFKGLKDKISKMILDQLGVSPDPNAFFRQVMTAFMKKVGILELKDLITGSTTCINVASKLAQSIINVFTKSIPKMLDMISDGPIAKAIIRSLESAFSKDFAQQLAMAFCKIDFRPLVKTIPGGAFIAKFLGAPAYKKGDTVEDVKASLSGGEEGIASAQEAIASGDTKKAKEELEKAAASL
jgi:hypothetical protein